MVLGSAVVELRSSLTTAGTEFFTILPTPQVTYLPAVLVVVAVGHGMWQSF